MGIWEVATIILGFTTLTGWIAALHQANRADYWMKKYHQLREDKLREAFMVGAGVKLTEKALDFFGVE